MPKRPSEHEVGESAVAAVCNVLARAKLIYEEVQKDYGEDILVKTSHEGHVDANRLWIQVKGTENIDSYRLVKWNQKKGEFSYPVSLDTAIRWVRSVDLVVVVLWDIEADQGWYAVPSRQVDDWKGIRSGKKETRLYFGSFDHNFKDEPRPFTKGVFDVAAAERLAWESRFEHIRLLLLDARDAAREAGRPDNGRSRSIREALILAEFLKLLGMVDPDVEPGHLKINEETLELCDTIAGNLGPEILESEEIRERVTAAAVMAVQRRAYEKSPYLGMPKFLLVAGAAALATALELGEQADLEAYITEKEARLDAASEE